MKKIMKKMLNGKAIANYCENVLRMYNFGRVNCLA